MDLQTFEKQYLAGLNEQQRTAVETVDGPVLLLATPGSGKTTVLVTRLGYMVHVQGLDPRSILTMTYTVAAAEDMRARYAAFFGEENARALQFRTINGVSASIIAYTGRRHVGREPFALLNDEGELNRIVRTIYQELNDGNYPEDSEVREIRRLITYSKNMMLSEEEIQALDTNIDKLPEILRRYKSTLAGARQMDYDDQMAYAYNILQRVPEVLADYQERYRYLCVDEAQDTSKIQHAIIRLLAAKHENLFMVGDEDQSIYGFRAAYPDALLNFEQEHPGARVLLMEQNYRSTAPIVAVANRFVAENRFRREKTIVPTRDEGSPVHLIRAKNRAAQYAYLVGVARRCTAQTAILFRNNDTALPLIDRFERLGLPYNSKNVDDQFFTSRVVVDILDILRFAYAPTDADLFLRLYYKFGAPISKKSALYAVSASRSSKKPLFEELMRAPEIRGPAKDAVIDLMENLPRLPSDPAETAIHRVWEAMHYGRYVEQRRLDPGKYFILCLLAQGLDSPQAFLQKLDSLRTAIANHRNASENRVILSTIHSSKGLEYDSVYLCDVIDGILPSLAEKDAKTLDEIKTYQEERRLYYVGMTRAKNDLFLFTCGETSGFTAEVMRSLPVPVPEPGDLFAPLLVSQLGRQFYDKRLGRGEIAAEGNGLYLVVFPDGQQELLSLEEMLSRRGTAVKYVAPEEAPRPQPVPKRPGNPVVRSQLAVGVTVRHKRFGEGKILAIEGDLLTADFGAKGIRKLGLTPSLEKKLLFL